MNLKTYRNNIHVLLKNYNLNTIPEIRYIFLEQACEIELMMVVKQRTKVSRVSSMACFISTCPDFASKFNKD
ncbi:hypothetical protein [Clostridium saccharoperbutylacetonicum]|uniref:hypothetical protein n=1 Tax=Clostridium saccharoperbutylacetonicum TaxID=36745 RepID=UPI00036DCE79|nr:hypothetical protein [Clostridium saccharoperbutylacetonicum]